MDFTHYPMGAIGGIIALGVFFIFMGTWWWYGMRVHEARAMVSSGRAILVDVDDEKMFASHPIAGARNIPLDALEQRAVELASKTRTVIVCGHVPFAGLRARLRLRRMGLRVIGAGTMAGL